MCQGCLYHFILNSALTHHIFDSKDIMTGFQIFLTNQLQIYKKTQVLCLQQLQQKSLSTWCYVVHTKIIPHHAQTTQKRGLDTKNTRHCRCCFPNGGTTWSTVADEIYRLSNLAGPKAHTAVHPTNQGECSLISLMCCENFRTIHAWLMSVTGKIWPRSSNDMTYLCWLLCLIADLVRVTLSFPSKQQDFLLEWKSARTSKRFAILKHLSV